MPKATNIKTGKTKFVTEEEKKQIQNNKILAPLYTFSETKEPKEVTEMKEEAARESKEDTDEEVAKTNPRARNR